jgi:DNA-binding beta-propeller fold protein YncE
MPSRPIPLAALALFLSGCLDFSFKPAHDDDPNDAVSDDDGDGDEAPSCPTKAKACTDRCGLVELDGCTPYQCEPCCRPTVSCESIVAQCGSLDTGCGTVECPNRCDEGVSCLENRCCVAEPAATTCRGLCGGSAVNNCGDEVACENPCGQHSSGCRDAAPSEAALCFCPHAYQGETCEEKQLPFMMPVDVAFDTASGNAYVLDEGLGAVIVVDLETGKRWTLSDADDDGVARGVGDPLMQPRRIALDVARRRAYVTDLTLHAVVQIHLDHGHRTYVTGQGVGSGPELKYPKGIVLDANNDVAYVSDADALFAVRLSTGVRRIVSSAAAGSVVGAGPAVHVQLDLGADLASNRAYMFGAEALFAIDLTTGDRTLISTGFEFALPDGTLRGSGPYYTDAMAGALDLVNGRAFVADVRYKTVFAIDLESGDRSIVSTGADRDGVAHGAGPALGLPFGLRLDAAGTGLWLVDNSLAAVGHVDIATGDRSFRVDGGVGPGLPFDRPQSIAFDPLRSRALVVDTRLWKIIQVDLASGARSELPGSGVELKMPWDITIDQAGAYAYLADSQVGIVRIDLDTGVRHLVSDENDESLGPDLGSLPRLTLDEPRQQLLVPGVGNVLAVSLATGERTILSDSTHGSGPIIQSSSEVAFDAANHTALVIDRSNRALYKLDVATGVRTFVSGRGPDGAVRGTGKMFDYPHDVAFDAATRQAFVLDDDLRCVFAVDLTTGDRTIISVDGGHDRRGTGMGFATPQGFVPANGGRLLVVDPILGAVFGVDVATGNRTIVSRVTF